MSHPNIEKMLPHEPDSNSESLETVSPTQSALVPRAKTAPKRNWISPESIRTSYQPKIASSEVTTEQVDLLTQLFEIGKISQQNLSVLAHDVGISETTLHRLWHGNYAAKLDGVLTTIANYINLWRARAEMGRGEFVETSIARTCWQACDLARAHGVPVGVYGESQLGKTTAFERYRADHHSNTFYVRVPAGGSLYKFQRVLSEALGFTTNATTGELSERPKRILNTTTLLIIDELHQCVLATRDSGVQVKTLEYIREVYDKTSSGMILCGTHIARDAMERGRHTALLEQLRRRGIPPIQLPPLLPDDDLDRIAASYNLPAAPSEIGNWRRNLVRSTGVKAYVTFLRMAGTIAGKRHETPTWTHVIAAHDILAKLSTSTGAAK